MKQIKMSYLVIAVIVLFLAANSLFTVQETQRALVVRLGKLVTDSKGAAEVLQPGLHIRWPFISNVVRLDNRLQTLELDDSRIVTSEKKDVIVSSYIKWRIKDFKLYYIATSDDITKTRLILTQKMGNELRAQFGRRSISEVVSGEREDVMAILQQQINKSAEETLGVEVLDVRVKRIDLPLEVSESVFGRMRAERAQAAAEHRADGTREAEKIRAAADAKVTVLFAEANKKSQELRGDGDAKAAAIYAQAYNKDPEFFSFYRSLKAYRSTLSSKNDLLVLSPESEFFQYFNDAAKAKKEQ